jgi:alpha-tubulin suppressor-like RCC1 family protein
MLGDGSRSNRSSPVRMLGIDDAIEVVVPGHYKTCVLRADRTVWCLGLNRGGQLGDGSTTDRSSPTAVRGVSNVVQLGRGATGYHMMATTMDNGTFSWGQGSSGVLGHGNTESYSAPRRIDGF